MIGSDILQLLTPILGGMGFGTYVVKSPVRHVVVCPCGFQAVKYHKMAKHGRNVHGERVSRRFIRKIAFTEKRPAFGMGATVAILQRRMKERTS